MQKERDQLKAPNSKLIEKVEILQSTIDGTASAHQYYYNKKGGEGDDTTAEAEKQAKLKSDSQADKVRKIFED